MSTIYIGLNDKGRATLTEFLRQNLKDPTLVEDRLSAFEIDVDVDQNPGHFELEGRFSKTSNPVDYQFELDELETAESEDV